MRQCFYPKTCYKLKSTQRGHVDIFGKVLTDFLIEFHCNFGDIGNHQLANGKNAVWGVLSPTFLGRGSSHRSHVEISSAFLRFVTKPCNCKILPNLQWKLRRKLGSYGWLFQICQHDPCDLTPSLKRGGRTPQKLIFSIWELTVPDIAKFIKERC